MFLHALYVSFGNACQIIAIQCMHALYTHRKAVFITKSRNLFVIPRRDFPRAKGTLYGSTGECAHPCIAIDILIRLLKQDRMTQKRCIHFNNNNNNNNEASNGIQMLL